MRRRRRKGVGVYDSHARRERQMLPAGSVRREASIVSRGRVGMNETLLDSRQGEEAPVLCKLPMW